MKYGLFQTMEFNEHGGDNPCWYVYDIYDTLQDAIYARDAMLYPSFFLIMPVYQ